MNTPPLPLVIEAAELFALGQPDDVLVVDLSAEATYRQQHVPGAIHLDYTPLVRRVPPALGLLPDAAHLSAVFSALGLHEHLNIVAYDDEGSTKACRLIWTLHVLGHTRASLLNGGLAAWLASGYPADHTAHTPIRREYVASIDPGSVADKAYIRQHLNDPRVQVLDVRSPGEYSGQAVRAARGGHIPGAINVEWTRAIDEAHHRRLKPRAELAALYASHGIKPEQEIIVHCHSHQRSAHSYVVLKHIGYPQVRAYPGSWSEWGNDPETPISTAPST